MYEHSYAIQKFWEATHSLITSNRMRTRLGFALFLLSQLQSNQLPEKLRPRFEGLIKQLRDRRVPFPHKMCEVNMRAPLSDKIAKEIFDLFVALKGGI
jgi:hypothetical protein